MKSTISIVLFIFVLLGFVGTSGASVIQNRVERFEAFCMIHDHIIVHENSVELISIEPNDRYITMLTDDNRKIITASNCTFTHLKNKQEITSFFDEDTEFPEDVESPYIIDGSG